MWRQGDVLIQRIDEIPPDAKKTQSPVLAHGVSTGHCHGIADRKSAQVYVLKESSNRQLYLDVTEESAQVEHPEHRSITLPKGKYRVWQQREFTDKGIQRVYD